MAILFSIFLISFSILSYEILLMRVFSITSWSHFAYMIISIALLGFGASGTFISLLQARLKKHFYFFFTLFSLLFSLSLWLCFVLSQKIPFNPFLIVWYKRQYLYLMEYYLLLFIPFFLGASCIGLSFSQLGQKINKIYFSNLLGSGSGALGVIFLMYLLSPTSILLLITAVAFLSTLISSLCLIGKGPVRREKKWDRLLFSIRLFLDKKVACPIFLILFTLASLLFFYIFSPTLNISQYKSLRVALNLPQARVLKEVSSPLGLIDVVESPAIRYAPGLSLNFKGEIPPQLALFTDADSMSAITNFQNELSNLRYLDYITSALPYHLLDKPEVLIVGAGGGGEVLTALYHGAALVNAVELNPQVVNLVKDEYAEFSNRIYSHPLVRVFIKEGRGFIQSTRDEYGLIQIALLDSFSASSAGVYALSESYLYTKEAMREYIRHLSPEGILCITRWLKMPARDGIKLFATAVESLEESGMEDPSSHLIFIRSWATSTLLIKRSFFTPLQIKRARDFCQERLFDFIWYPGIESGEVNRYSVLPEPYYYQAAQGILSEKREDFYRSYLFYIKPATDNSPYFFHFFKWRSLPHLLKTMGKQWIPFIEWSYIVLVATLLQAIGISIILIILPLFFLKKVRNPARGRLPIFSYFLSLGVGYMFVEISFIQKFTLFLSYPIYAVAVVIAGFLFFSGWGSYLSERIHIRGLSNVSLAVGVIIIISLIYLFYLGRIFSLFISYRDAVKILLSLLFIAPLAFFMGMPFPLGLTRVSSKAASLVPWAWGINGCASVISTVLATFLALSIGFNLVIVIALSLYTLAAVSLARFP